MSTPNEEKNKTESGTGSIQREASSSKKEDEVKKLRKEIIGIREGHTTGGYCETEKLQAKEKELYKILHSELEALKQEHGYSTDPKFKHPSIRKIELELHGLSYKPKTNVVIE